MRTAIRHRTTHPARDLCLAPGRTIDAPVTEGGRYGRMFPDLPAATFDDDRLLALGVEGSICDGGAWDEGSHVEAGPPLFGPYLAPDPTPHPAPLPVAGNTQGLRKHRPPPAHLQGPYAG